MIEMMRRDGAGDARRMRPHDVGGLRRRHVFDNGFQAGVPFKERQQRPLHEHRFAVENIDRRIGGLAMDQHRHADLLHTGKHRSQPGYIGYAVMRIGGRAGRIELGGGPNTLGKAFLDFVGRRAVGQIAGHQRLEVGA